MSSPASICIVVRPVTFSPLTIAQLIGAAPRYFGSKGTVEIDPAEPRNRNQRRWNDLPVGDDDDHIRSEPLEIIEAMIRT